MASFDAWVIDPFTLSTSMNVSVFIGDRTLGRTYEEGYDDGYEYGFDDGEAAGQAAGYVEGYVDGNHTDFVYAGAVITVPAQDYAGQPITGLTPTFSVYLNSVSGASQSAPAISEVSGGHYKFTPSGTAPCGIVNLGSGATPRYHVYSYVGEFYVFAAYDDEGQPLAGLVPVWLNLKKVSDGTDAAQPAITELSGGLYKTTLLREHVAGLIDLGDSAYPRYLPYDSESLLGLGYSLGYAAGQEATNMLVVNQSVAKTVSVRTVSASTGLPITVTGPDLAAAVVTLKKAGGAFATITPTLTQRDTFIDIDLTAAHLNTLGIADLVVEIPSSVSLSLKMDVQAFEAAMTAAFAAVNANVDAAETSINANVDAAEVSINANVDAAETSINANVDGVQTDVSAVKSDTASTLSVVNSMQTTLTELHKVAIGRWKIMGNQLIIYDTDETTPLRVFDLFDDEGNPSQVKIFERVPA